MMSDYDTDAPPVEQDEDWYRRMGMPPVGPGGTAPFMPGPAYDTPPVSTGGVPGERPPATPSPARARNYDAGEPPNVSAPPVSSGAPPVAAAPRGLNLAEDAASGRAAPPVRSNYQAQPISRGRRALAALAGGLVGYRDPRAGYEMASDIVSRPEREADKRFGEDTAQFNEARQEGRQQAVERRQAATAELEAGLRSAQVRNIDSEIKHRDDAKEAVGEKKVDEGFNAQNQRVVTWQRPDGSRYSEVNPQIVQKAEGGNQNDFERYYTKYLEDNNLPDSARNRLMAKKLFTEAGREPHEATAEDKAISDYLAANKLENTPENRLKARGVLKPKAEGGPGGKFEEASATAASKDVETARGGDFRYRSMAGSYPRALKGDQQAMVNLLTNHIGMTLGMQKGARITKDILNEAQKSVPWLQGVSARWDKQGYLSGVVLTPDQMGQMMGLAQSQRANGWAQAIESARQAGVADRLKIPGDVRIRVTSPDGKAGTIPGSQLGQAEDKGYVVSPQ